MKLCTMPAHFVYLLLFKVFLIKETLQCTGNKMHVQKYNRLTQSKHFLYVV